MSEISTASHEWVSSPLIEMADYFNGVAFKPKDWGLDGLPIIRIEQLNKPESKTDKYSGLLLPSNYIDTGDLIFSWSATLKVLIWKHGPGALNQHLYKVVPKRGVEKLLLLHLLDFNMEKLAAQSQGSTMRHVTRKELSRFQVAFPKNVPTQQKIARILQTVDRAMEKTETLIEKYQQIKAGLMHDLFKRGLWTQDELDHGDHQGTPAEATAKSGQLRPTRQDAPDLYQETPIGWIPKAWSSEFLEVLLAPVSNNLRSGPFGSALLKSELVEDGIPFLGIDNIHVEKFVGIFRRFVSERKYKSLIKYSVRPKDVVITIMGTVGRSAIIPEDTGPALSSKHLWTMTFDQEKVFPELLCWQLNYASWVKAWFRRETQGGIMDAIQSKTLRTLRLPVPLIDEQKEIKKRYDAISSKLETESLRLGKLHKQKSGLMHDLLTGEVSVTPDPEEASDV